MSGKYQNQIQLQKQLNKQKLTLLQHQRNMCEIIFSAMASAEKVALKISSNKEYKSYDPYNTAAFKNEIQLENEFANKLIFLRSGLLAYKMEHGNFIFPYNDIKQEMINDVKKWASSVSNRPKAIKSYNILIEMLNGSTKEVPKECFHNVETKIDEKYVLDKAENLMKIKVDLINQDKEVENDFIKTGDHNIPFKKERNIQNDENFNEYLKAEKNVDDYLNYLIEKAVSNKPINKEEETMMWKFISLLNKALNFCFLEQNIITPRLSYYQNQINQINNAKLKCSQNIQNIQNTQYELISKYSRELYRIYSDNSKNI